MWTCLFMAPREDSVKYTIRTIAIISNAIIHNSAATDKSAVKKFKKILCYQQKALNSKTKLLTRIV